MKQRGMKQRVMVGHTRCTTAKGSRTGSAGSRVLHQLGPVPARWTRSSALPPQTPPGAIAAGFLAIVMARSAPGQPTDNGWRLRLPVRRQDDGSARQAAGTGSRRRYRHRQAHRCQRAPAALDQLADLCAKHEIRFAGGHDPGTARPRLAVGLVRRLPSPRNDLGAHIPRGARAPYCTEPTRYSAPGIRRARSAACGRVRPSMRQAWRPPWLTGAAILRSSEHLHGARPGG